MNLSDRWNGLLSKGMSLIGLTSGCAAMRNLIRPKLRNIAAGKCFATYKSRKRQVILRSAFRPSTDLIDTASDVPQRFPPRAEAYPHHSLCPQYEKQWPLRAQFLTLRRHRAGTVAPYRPFEDEWSYLHRDGRDKRYKQFHAVEGCLA